MHASLICAGSRNCKLSGFQDNAVTLTILGLGQSIQYAEQQRSFWREKAKRNRQVNCVVLQSCRLKRSASTGRELGSYALREYTDVKAVHWNFGEQLEWPL